MPRWRWRRGSRFAIREGGRTVGAGAVTKVTAVTYQSRPRSPGNEAIRLE